MKVKRHKRIRKFTSFYKVNFGIKPPYKVVVDGEFLQAVLEGKIMLQEQLPKILQEQTTACVSKCVIADLKTKGGFYRGAVMIGERCQFLRCKHSGIVPPEECLAQLIADGNPDHLFVGAQTISMRAAVRKQPGVPLLFIRGQVPVLEPPSKRSLKINTKKLDGQSMPSEQEMKLLATLRGKNTKSEGEGEGAGAKKKSKKKKGPKQPNSLSVKKKKKGLPGAPADKIKGKGKGKGKNKGKSGDEGGEAKAEKKGSEKGGEAGEAANGAGDSGEGGASDAAPRKRKRSRVRVRVRAKKTKGEDGEATPAAAAGDAAGDASGDAAGDNGSEENAAN